MAGHKRKQKRANRYAQLYNDTHLEAMVNVERAFEGPTVDLASEIELMRGVCGNAVQILSRCITGFVDKADGDVAALDPKTMHAALSYTEHAISRVASLVERQAKIHALTKGTYDESFIGLLVTRLTTHLQKRLLPDNKELFETCCADMEEIVKSANDEAGKAPAVQVNIS